MINKILGYLNFRSLKSPLQDDKDRDIYGRVIEDAEVYFYPRPVRGLPLLSRESILKKYRPKIQELKQRIPIGDQHISKTGKPLTHELYWFVIDRFIEYVHMIPASEDHHHSGPGGLFFHSLEASIYAMRAATIKRYESTGMIDLDRDMAPRARYAAWLGALIHDVGKVLGDVSVDAVTAFSKSGQIINSAHNDIPTWKPELCSIYSWAKEHGVVTYSVSYRKDRRHNRHNIDTVLMLRQIVGSGVAMDYLTDGPVNLHRELGRVLSNYESSKDYLSICVREGDVISTAKDMSVYTKPNTGSAQLSTPSRIYRALKMARRSWEWNQRGQDGWIIGGRVHIKWPNAIESIVRSAIENNVGIPHSAKTVVSIMEENGMLNRFESTHLTIKFSPGNFSHSDANMVLRGEKNVHWEELLRFAWNGTVFETDPIPDNARGLIFLSETTKMFIADDKGGITPVGMEPDTLKVLNIKPENAGATIANKEETVQQTTALSTELNGAKVAETLPENTTNSVENPEPEKAKKTPAKKKNATKVKTKAELKEEKATPVIEEVDIDIAAVTGEPEIETKSQGVSFAQMKTKAKKSIEATEIKQANAKPSKQKQSAANAVTPVKPPIQKLIDAVISVTKDDNQSYATLLVSELDRAFGTERNVFISELKQSKMLFVDPQTPTQIIHVEMRNGHKAEVVRLKSLAIKMFPAHLISESVSKDQSLNLSPLEIIANNATEGSLAQYLLKIPMENLKAATYFSEGNFAYRNAQMAIELKKHTDININTLYNYFVTAGHKPVKVTLDGVNYEQVAIEALHEVVNV